MPLPTGFVLVPAADLVRLADRVGVATGEREIGRVVEHEDQPIHRGKALARGLKVSGQDLRLAYAVVVEEAVRRLGAGPISAGQRNRSADAFRELLHQDGKTLSETDVGEIAAYQFLVDP